MSNEDAATTNQPTLLRLWCAFVPYIVPTVLIAKN